MNVRSTIVEDEEANMYSKIGGVAGMALCAWLALGQPALAHHSFAGVFDETKELTLSGTLSSVSWVNPHAFFEVKVPNKDGTATTWRFENFPPGMLRSLGLNRTDMTDNIGRKVTVLYNPARKAGASY